jgi:hypothetical protein
MSDIGHAIEAAYTLLDMLGSVVRKAIRGKRTTYFREWRSRDNALLGAGFLMVSLLTVVLLVHLIHSFIK